MARPCQLFGAGDRGGLDGVLLLAEFTDACRLAFESHDLTELVRELSCVGASLATARTRVGLFTGDWKGSGACRMRSGSKQTSLVSGSP